jgi:hypothetical protein
MKKKAEDENNDGKITDSEAPSIGSSSQDTRKLFTF